MAFLVLLALYFLPAVVAGFRKHRQAAPIFVLDLLLGWTVIGWIIALIWSLTAPAAPQVVVIHQPTGQG